MVSTLELLVAPDHRPPARNEAEEARLLGLVHAGRLAAGELEATTDPEERRRLEAAVRAGEQARGPVVEAHQGLVAKVARRYRYSGVPMADLMQEGNVGLIAALDRFDATAGTRFASFAWFWIRQTILAGIPLHRQGFTLSPGVAREAYRVRKVRAELESRLGREAYVAEVAAQAGLTAERVAQLESLNHGHQLLSDQVASTAVNVDYDGDPSSLTGRELTLRAVRDLVDQLPTRERFVIRCRYVLEQRLSDIARTLGVTPSRVCQIEREALGRLRRMAAAHDDLLVA